METITHEPMIQISPMVSAQAAIKTKRQESYELSCDIAEFVNRGGKIIQCDNMGEPVKDVYGSYANNMDKRRQNALKTRSQKQESKSGILNIWQTKTGKWTGAVNKIGLRTHDTKEAAIAARDRLRETLGLEPAPK